MLNQCLFVGKVQDSKRNEQGELLLTIRVESSTGGESDEQIPIILSGGLKEAFEMLSPGCIVGVKARIRTKRKTIELHADSVTLIKTEAKTNP